MVSQHPCGQLAGLYHLIYAIHSLSASALMGIKFVLTGWVILYTYMQYPTNGLLFDSETSKKNGWCLTLKFIIIKRPFV